MTKKDYAECLKFVLKIAVDNYYEEMQKPNSNEEYLSGVITGLQIAMDKIDASAFLTEE